MAELNVIVHCKGCGRDPVGHRQETACEEAPEPFIALSELPLELIELLRVRNLLVSTPHGAQPPSPATVQQVQMKAAQAILTLPVDGSEPVPAQPDPAPPAAPALPDEPDADELALDPIPAEFQDKQGFGA